MSGSYAGSVRTVNGQPLFTARVAPGHSEQPLDSVAALAGMILCQAATDGMTGIALSASPGGTSIAMRYIRERDGQSQHWDMIPPPAHLYAGLVGALISLTRFNSGAQARGEVHCCINDVPLVMTADFSSWYDVRLTWRAPPRAVWGNGFDTDPRPRAAE